MVNHYLYTVLVPFRDKKAAATPEGRPPRLSIKCADTVDDPGSGLTLHESVRAAQYGLDLSPIRTDHTGGYLGPLPEVLVSGLRDRDIVPGAETVPETPDDTPLLFQ
jgi:hypothetical protein